MTTTTPNPPGIVCKDCGELMVFEPADPGEPPTPDQPMGGAPATPAVWVCECGRCEKYEDGTFQE